MAGGALTRAISSWTIACCIGVAPQPAVLLGPQHPDVARLVELAVPRLALVERLQLLLRDVALEPATGRGAELAVFRRVVQIHRVGLPQCALQAVAPGPGTAEARFMEPEAVAGLGRADGFIEARRSRTNARF